MSDAYYVIYRGKIGRVLDSLRAARDVAFSDYDGPTKVVTRRELHRLGLDPTRQSDWFRAGGSASRAKVSDAVYERDLQAIVHVQGSLAKAIEWCERNARLGGPQTKWFEEAAERLRAKLHERGQNPRLSRRRRPAPVRSAQMEIAHDVIRFHESRKGAAGRIRERVAALAEGAADPALKARMQKLLGKMRS